MLVANVTKKNLGLPPHDPNGVGVYALLYWNLSLQATDALQPVAVWSFGRAFSRVRLGLRAFSVNANVTLELRLDSFESCDEGAGITWFSASKAFTPNKAAHDETVGVSAGIPGEFAVLFARVTGAGTVKCTPRVIVDRNEGALYSRLATGWA